MQLYLLNIVTAIIVFVISFFITKKKRILGILLIPLLYLSQNLYVFLTKYSPVQNAIIDATSKYVKTNFFLGVGLFLLIEIILILISRKKKLKDNIPN